MSNKKLTLNPTPELYARDGLNPDIVAPWEDGQQFIARLVANPYYFRFNANLQLDIDLPGVQAFVQGRALFEMMMLR